MSDSILRECSICQDPLLPCSGGSQKEKDNKHNLLVRIACPGQHTFHPTCLEAWALIQNSCPMDRTPFSRMLYFYPSAPDDIVKSVVAPERTISETLLHDDSAAMEWQQYLNIMDCEICHKRDEDEYSPDYEQRNPMILCDQCDDGYHIHCMKLKAVPLGDWFCPNCVKERQAKRAKKNNASRASNRQRRAVAQMKLLARLNHHIRDRLSSDPLQDESRSLPSFGSSTSSTSASNPRTLTEGSRQDSRHLSLEEIWNQMDRMRGIGQSNPKSNMKGNKKGHQNAAMENRPRSGKNTLERLPESRQRAYYSVNPSQAPLEMQFPLSAAAVERSTFHRQYGNLDDTVVGGGKRPVKARDKEKNDKFIDIFKVALGEDM